MIRFFDYLFYKVYIMPDLLGTTEDIDGKLLDESGSILRDRVSLVVYKHINHLTIDNRKLNKSLLLDNYNVHLDKLKRNLHITISSIGDITIKKEKLLSQSIKDEILTMQKDIEHLESLIKTSKDSYNSKIERRIQEHSQCKILENKLILLNKDSEDIQERTASLEEELEKGEKSYSSKATQLDSLKSEMRSLDDSHRDIILSIHKLEVEAKSTAKEVFNLNKTINKETEEYKNNKIQIELLTEKIESSRIEQSDDKDKINDLNSKQQDITVIIKELKNRCKNYELDIEQLKDNYRDLSTEERRLREDIEIIKDEKRDVEKEIDSIKNKVSIEFQVNIEEMGLESIDKKSILMEESIRRIESLRKKLENYKTINHSALENYKVVKSRYDDITSQRDDLIKSKNLILDSVKKIDKVIVEKFRKTFDSVREKFIEIFHMLFDPEDKCDLILTSNEISEAYIEVIAQPKGKKPTVIDQLSQGEKSMTAIALLFALYFYNPSPFCILDEIDAPLDDSNVMKFVSMVEKFSTKSQFIIITHNKMTISMSNIIYGITMSEPGISIALPVDINKVMRD